MRHLGVWVLSCLVSGATGPLFGVTDLREYMTAFTWLGMGVFMCWVHRRALSKPESTAK